MSEFNVNDRRFPRWNNLENKTTFVNDLENIKVELLMAPELDDLLDITGDAKTIGKPAGNDILQGIITLPTIRALEVSPDKDELMSIVTDPDMTNAMLDRALELVRATDGVDFTKAKVDDYLSRAKANLPDSIPQEIRETYYMAADFISGREF